MRFTKLQSAALLRKWNQSDQGMTFLAFRRSAYMANYDNCVMVQWCGMWLGIEADGYCHS